MRVYNPSAVFITLPFHLNISKLTHYQTKHLAISDNKMPLLLSNNGINIFIWNLTTSNTNYTPYNVYLNVGQEFLGNLFKFVIALNLFKSFYTTSHKGISHGKSYGSLDHTVITIEADETTHLLADRENADKFNNNNNMYVNEKPILKSGHSSWSFASSNQSSGSGCSKISTKSFKSHFTELKVMAFALILLAAITIAIYLLIIESRLPSITFSLDLVSHDVWSQKPMSNGIHLKPQNVDHIIIMQTGNNNCDTSWECLKLMRKMQNENLNKSEELPYNFLIGGDGLTYEVRGWDYQSNIKGIPQEHSLIIGIMGNFDYQTPQRSLLQTVQSLIKESNKRHKINSKYHIYALRRSEHHRNEGKQLFKEILNWPQFKSFL